MPASMAVWLRWLEHRPVTAEIAGSSPVTVAKARLALVILPSVRLDLKPTYSEM
jgi:hypothetical protein